eukprot:sb/3466444/
MPSLLQSTSPDSPRSSGMKRMLVFFFAIVFIGLLYIISALDYTAPAISAASASLKPLRVHLDFSEVESSKKEGEEETVVTTNTTIRELPSYTFIIFIITAPDNTEIRTILRETSWVGHNWGDEMSWRHVFVVGRVESAEKMALLRSEMDQYGDMVMADELDTYRNLVLKVLWILEHALENYQFKFIIKTDDDSFINISLLHNYLIQLVSKGQDNRFFGGVRVTNSKVFRRGRYMVEKELWAPDVYAPYCSGSGYVLSHDAVEALLEVYKSGVQPLFYVEDAYMGALAYHTGDINVQKIPGFYWHQKYGCMDRNAKLMHYVKKDQLGPFMERYLEGKTYC